MGTNFIHCVLSLDKNVTLCEFIETQIFIVIE